MSLDLSNKTGMTSAGTPAAGLTAFPVDADFAESMEDNASAKVYIDTSGGDITLTPGAITGVEEGDELTFIKATADANRIIFTDPVDSFVYNYVNRRSESITLQYDGTQWIAKI